jgi:hypothetical protein
VNPGQFRRSHAVQQLSDSAERSRGSDPLAACTTPTTLGRRSLDCPSGRAAGQVGHEGGQLRRGQTCGPEDALFTAGATILCGNPTQIQANCYKTMEPPRGVNLLAESTASQSRPCVKLLPQNRRARLAPSHSDVRLESTTYFRKTADDDKGFSGPVACLQHRRIGMLCLNWRLETRAVLGRLFSLRRRCHVLIAGSRRPSVPVFFHSSSAESVRLYAGHVQGCLKWGSIRRPLR